MAKQAFYQVDGKIFGPVATADELRLLANQGVIKPTTPLRSGTDGPWIDAGRFRQLFHSSNPGVEIGADEQAISDLGYYRDDEKVRGPFSPSDLKRLVSEGKITASTLIRRGKDGQWIEAKRVGGLSPKLSETAELRDAGVLPQSAPPVTLAEESGHSLPQRKKLGTTAIARPPEPAPAPPPSSPIVCVPQLPTNNGAGTMKVTAFRVICGQCHGNLLVEQFGVVVACPHCGVHLSIPSPEGPIVRLPEPASHAREFESAQHVVAPVKKTLATSNLPDGRNTMKVATVVCIILAVIVPFWPISAPLFLYLANKSFKDPN